MDTLKDFGIATTFIIVCAVCILFFALGYPALNNKQSVLISDERFNHTAGNLSILLGTYQEQQNTEINVSTADQPTIDAQSLQLVSTVSTSRTFMSRVTGSFKLILNLLGNIFGLSGGALVGIIGALTALFGFVILYLVVKMIRYGT